MAKITEKLTFLWDFTIYSNKPKSEKMKHLIKEKNGVFYVEYNMNKSINDDKKNLIIYTSFEQMNLNEMGLDFPFYYTSNVRYLQVNSDNSVLNQVYSFINGLYQEYKTARYLIIKLNFEIIYQVMEFNIFPVIDKNSDLGDTLRINCKNSSDYLNICLSDSPKESLFKRKFLNYYPEDKDFLEFIPYLNCGIFQYGEDEKVNRTPYWEPSFFKGDLLSEIARENMNEFEREFEHDEIDF